MQIETKYMHLKHTEIRLAKRTKNRLEDLAKWGRGIGQLLSCNILCGYYENH